MRGELQPRQLLGSSELCSAFMDSGRVIRRRHGPGSPGARRACDDARTAAGLNGASAAPPPGHVASTAVRDELCRGPRDASRAGDDRAQSAAPTVDTARCPSPAPPQPASEHTIGSSATLAHVADGTDQHLGSCCQFTRLPPPLVSLIKTACRALSNQHSLALEPLGTDARHFVRCRQGLHLHGAFSDRVRDELA